MSKIGMEARKLSVKTRRSCGNRKNAYAPILFGARCRGGPGRGARRGARRGPGRGARRPPTNSRALFWDPKNRKYEFAFQRRRVEFRHPYNPPLSSGPRCQWYQRPGSACAR